MAIIDISGSNEIEDDLKMSLRVVRGDNSWNERDFKKGTILQTEETLLFADWSNCIVFWTGVGYVIGVHGGINPVRGVDLKIRSNREAEKWDYFDLPFSPIILVLLMHQIDVRGTICF